VKPIISKIWNLAVFSALLLSLPLLAGGANPPPQTLDEEPVIEQDAISKLKELMDEPERFIGIEILEAQGTKELESFFGHSVIRLVDNDGDAFNDIVFNFYPVMKTEEGEEVEGTSFKAFIKHYQLGVEMNTFQNIGLRYIKHYGRELYRVPVLSTPENRRKLLLDIEKVINDPELRGHYTAMGNNCLGVILDALRRSGFPTPSRHSFLPAGTRSYFKDVGLSPYPETTVYTADALLAKHAQNLDQAESLLMQEKFEKALNTLSVESAWVALSLKERHEIPDDFYEMILRKTFETEGSVRIRDRMFGAAALDPMLYSLCSSMECASAQMQTLRPKMKIIAPKAKDTKQMVKMMRGEFVDEKPLRRVRTPQRSHNLHKKVASKFVEWHDLRDDIELHYELLYKAAR